jgi:hypothetical protein
VEIMATNPIYIPETTKRHYYRCQDCLQVSTTTELLPIEYGTISNAICICGGKIDYIGKVKQERIGYESEQSVCDCRCTEATGPNCDCKCGGLNHGSHKTMTIFHDLGPIPVIKPVNPDKSIAIANEYRQAKDNAKAKVMAIYQPLLNKYSNRVWMDRTEFLSYVDSKRKLSRFWEICKMKQHSARIKAFNAL